MKLSTQLTAVKLNTPSVATDILLTQGLYWGGLGVPGQAWERRRRCSPQPGAAPSLTQACCAGESAAPGVEDRAAIGSLSRERREGERDYPG